MGDLNVRIGKGKDFIEDIDELIERQVIDENVNKHGTALLEFLQETKMCVLNGRGVTNDYTSSSTRGSAVVDYIMVPISEYPKFSQFRVNHVLI